MAGSELTARKPPETVQHALSLLESSSVFGCVVIDQNGSIRWVNALFRRWLETIANDGAMHRRLAEWLPRAEDRDAIQRSVETEGASGLAIELGSTDGTRIPLVGDFMPLGATQQGFTYAGVFQEGASEHKLKAGMERSARLEALGSLTSGVAHDFNNLLTILVGNLSLVTEELREDPKLLPKLKAARDAAKRGGELIKQLLSFARQEPVPSELINPAKVIDRIAPLIQRALGSRITFELELDDQVDAIQGNSAQLESVIVNLAVNARDAIEQQGSVRIIVAAANSDGSKQQEPGAASDRYLKIEVTDDGAGIPPEIVEKVFEPFFTTKASDRGSGLGLSMVKQYAEQFGGKAEILSEPGKGTTVRLLFPSSQATIADSAAMTMPLSALPGGSESIVVLARDENLSGMMEQILTVLGYQIRVASDMQTASAHLQSSRPDLVVCDGFEISPLIESQADGERDPSRLLMLHAMGSEEAAGSHPVLYKPFSIPDLAVAVRETLDGE